MRRFVAPILITGLLLLLVLSPVTQVAAAPSITTHAEAAALIDVTSGRILYSHNGDKPLRIASLTKIMTAIVAIENGRLSDKVKVSVRAYGVEGSSIYLKLGEEMSLQHMLYGLMLRSGNDAATAIAEHVGGTVEGFVMMMNEKAEQLGLANTHFENPSGLDADGHLSSANDLSKLTAYCLQNPVFRNIVKTPSIKVPNSYEKWDHLWRNKNKMLHLFEGADGVKTGYTKTAKRTLVSSATRGGQQLAAVTLNDGNDWADHARMLEYGFQKYPLRTLYEARSGFGDTELASPNSFQYPLTEDEQQAISYDVIQETQNRVSLALGRQGYGVIKLENKRIGALPLYDKNHQKIKESAQMSALAVKLWSGQADHWVESWTNKLRQVVSALFSN